MKRLLVPGIATPLAFMVAAAWLAGCGAGQPPSIPPMPVMPDTPESMTEPLAEPEPASPSPAPVAPEGAPSTPAAPAPQDEGQPCSAHADCKSGICEGEGCATNAGKCVSNARSCTKDLQEYCGCDGKTFSSSGSCPGGRFKQRGPCKP
jgi:hypothetical protein